MNIVPYSYNGTLINDTTNYKAYFPLENSVALQGSVDPIEVERAFLPPDFAAKTIRSKVVPITILMMGTVSTQLDALKKLFDVRDQTQRTLIVRDAADSNRQWQVLATCIGQPSVTGSATTFSLYIEDAVWSSVVTQTDSSWNVTATGSTNVITPIGNNNARPVISVTPTAGSIGYQYSRFCAITNNTASKLVNYPINVLGTSFNTAALVTAGKMQANGDDLRVIVDGAEKNRWLGAINTTATRVWSAITFDPKIDLVLIGALASSGAATLKFTRTTANIAYLRRLPKNSLMLIESEVVIIGTPNSVACTVPITARGQKGTSAAGHAIGTTLKWIQHDIWVKYGNSTIDAPVTDDSYKPIFNLATSTNTSWVYANFNSPSTPTRTGDWDGVVLRSTGKKSHIYTKSTDLVEDPSSAMGMSINSWLYGSKWQNEYGDCEWTLSNPCGISSVAATGKSYTTKVGNWANMMAVWGASADCTLNGVDYSPMFYLYEPTPINTWVAWSNSFSAYVSKAIKFRLEGNLAGLANGKYCYEVLTATVGLSAVPTITVGSELSSYSMDCTITNVTTGEYLTFAYPMVLGQTVIINCDSKTVAINNHSVFAGLQLSTARVNWLDLRPGANTLKFEQDYTSGVTVAISWQDRNS